MAGRLLLLVTLVSTIFCAAVNAYTLQIAYPLWRDVPLAAFHTLHKSYLARLWPVITLPHVVMFFASGALLWRRPAAISGAEAVVIFALDAGVVAVSALIAGPIHSRFERTGVLDTAGYRSLIIVSAVRVAMMAASTAVLCLPFWRLLSA